jgi:hypothetical protein
MGRFTIRREGSSFIVIDTVLKTKVDAAPSKSEAETILKRWKRKYNDY